MKVRLMGTVEECDAAIAVLRRALDVVEVSRPFPNRGDSAQVRVYVDIRMDGGRS